VLALILVPTLTFSQYPKTKKIGQDSVVIITIGQADTINKLYRSYHDSINNLQFKLKTNDSLLSIRTIEKDSFYNWKYNAEIPTITRNRVPTMGFLAKSLKLIGRGLALTFKLFFGAIFYFLPILRYKLPE